MGITFSLHVLLAPIFEKLFTIKNQNIDNAPICCPVWLLAFLSGNNGQRERASAHA